MNRRDALKAAVAGVAGACGPKAAELSTLAAAQIDGAGVDQPAGFFTGNQTHWNWLSADEIRGMEGILGSWNSTL